MKTKDSASKIVKNFKNNKGTPLPDMQILQAMADELGQLYQASVQTTASTKVNTVPTLESTMKAMRTTIGANIDDTWRRHSWTVGPKYGQ